MRAEPDNGGPAASSPQRLVPAVDRAARLFRMLEEEGAPLTNSELARRLGASKGAVREVLETLRHHGLVQRDESSKRYELGPRLIRLGAAAQARVDLPTVARPHLGALADLSGETAMVLRSHGDRFVIEEVAEQRRRRLAIVVHATPGSTIPLLAGACGKVVLAFGDVAALADDDRAAVADDEVAAVRADRFAVDDEEYFAGVRAVSAPVLDRDGRLAGVLLVSGLAASFAAERLRPVGAAVAAAADSISTTLGGVVPTTSEGEPLPQRSDT